MSKEDEAERKTFGGIIPARPKGALGPTPPPLDDLLKKRQTMFGELDPEPQPGRTMAPPADADPFEAFVEIMRILRRLPKKQQKLIIEMFADLLD